MRINKMVFALALISFLAISCKNEVKQETETKTEETTAKVEEANFSISGMTCEIGCAKTIASKLSAKEGVLDAKVIFSDSLAVVKYDANKTNKEDLIAFIDGIADGNTYKCSEATGHKTACKSECKMECCATGDKKDCSEKCKEECEKKCSSEKIACADDCKKECCANGDKKACSEKCKEQCEKECNAKKLENKTACAENCEKECCTKKA